MSPTTLPLYLLFAALAVLLPGIVIQRLARTRIDPALVIPLGGAACAGAYWATIALDRAWLFPALLASCALVFALPRRLLAGHPARGGVGVGASDEPRAALRAVLPAFLGLLAVLAIAQFGFNRKDADGSFVLDPLVTFDSAFHVGLTRELVLGHPPQLPGVSGFPIGYHLGTDLVRAAALRFAGIDPWDSLTRLDVVLWSLALMLALQALCRRLQAPPFAVALAPWTVLLTDFSFVFAGNPRAHWWADMLRGNLLLSLVYANPVVPALVLALGALVCLSRHLESGDRGALFLAALQALALPFFKVFLGAQLLLGLGVAFLLARGGRSRALVFVALPCAAATAALVLGQGGETVRVSLAPLDLVAITRETLGWAPLVGLPLVGWAAAWVLLSLGLRVLGLPEAIRSLRGTTVPSALGAMALCGWPLGLLFRVSAPEVLENQKFVNDAAYLVEQSGPLLWVFAALAFAGLARSRARRIAAVVALLLLATPATVQYVAKKAASPPARLPAAMVRAALVLERESRPGDVVMQRPGARYPPAPVVLVGRRVPYERFTPYLTQFASRAALEQRHELVYRFFRTEDRAEAERIARALGVRYLALYGSDRVRFDTSGLLVPLHEEEGARLFRLTLEP